MQVYIVKGSRIIFKLQYIFHDAVLI